MGPQNDADSRFRGRPASFDFGRAALGSGATPALIAQLQDVRTGALLGVPEARAFANKCPVLRPFLSRACRKKISYWNDWVRFTPPR